MSTTSPTSARAPKRLPSRPTEAELTDDTVCPRCWGCGTVVPAETTRRTCFPVGVDTSQPGYAYLDGQWGYCYTLGRHVSFDEPRWLERFQAPTHPDPDPDEADPADPGMAAIDLAKRVRDATQAAVDSALGTDPRHGLLARAVANKVAHDIPIPWSLSRHFRA